MIHVNSTELHRFRVAADGVDKRIVRSLRKSLRQIGQDSVDAVKDELAKAPPNDQPGTSGSRAAIAAGTRLTVSFGKNTAGVRIVSTNARLGAGHKGFVGAYEKKTLRHPVFGQRNVIVEQPTRPYFGSVIAKVFDREAEKAMEAAFKEAVRGIGGRV